MKAFLAVLFATFTDAMTYGVVAPVIPRIADYAELSTTQAGALVGSSAIGALASLYFRMMLLERIPPKTLMAWGAGVASVSFLLFHPDLPYPVLIALRLLHGAAGGSIWLGALNWVIAEKTEGEQGSHIGVLMAMYAIGNVCGPLLGIFPGPYLPLASLGVAHAVVLVFILIWCTPIRGVDMTVNWGALKDVNLGGGVISGLLAGGGLGLLYGFYPMVFQQYFTESGLAVLFSVVAVPTIIIAPFAGRLTDRFSAKAVMLTSAFVFYFMLTSVLFLNQTFALVSALLFVTAAYAAIETSGLSFTVKSAQLGPGKTNVGSATWGLFYDVGYFVVPVCSAFLAAKVALPYALVPFTCIFVLFLILNSKGK